MCYSNSGSFIELLIIRSFCIHGEACAKLILCSEKELNLKDSKLTQNFYGGFVRPVILTGRAAEGLLSRTTYHMI